MVRPIITKNKRQIQLNKGRVGVAFVLNQNLKEVREKNLLNKREIIGKTPAKNVRSIILPFKLHSSFSVFFK